MKKWIITFLSCCLIFAAAVVGFNMLVDPFGIFGDPIFDYYEYNMTQNPRTAKIAYIDRHHEKYDSYIFGCSKSSSYPVEELNEYLDAKFYNMFVYGGDLYDIEKMASYVLNNYEAKNVVLAIGPEVAYRYDSETDKMKQNLHEKVDESINPLTFYGKYMLMNPSYSFDKLKSVINRSYLPDASNVFNAQTGAYNKIKRDSEPIGRTEDYFVSNDRANFEITYQRPLNYIGECLAAVRSIKKLCDEKGINFILIGSPLYSAERECYDDGELEHFYRSLASVTDFYCFWGTANSVSQDARYFYDGYHFRNAVGSMALSKIFGGDGYVPENFGFHVTAETADAGALHISDKTQVAAIETEVPILMYHALTEDESEASDTVITAAAFEAQIKELSEAGYTSLFYSDLLSYVEKGASLPEKPILITFDDGYESNLTLAAPILQKYGMRATVSVIGVSVGKYTYKDTGKPMYPHFSLEEAKKWQDAAVLDFQSHTYDMHNGSYDDPARKGVLPFDGESEDEYISALKADFEKSVSQIEAGLGNDVFVMTYPNGYYDTLSEAVLLESGAKISVSVERGTNKILAGLVQSLRCLKRYNMTDGTVIAEILPS